MAYKKSKKLDPAKEEEITRTQWARYERARDNGHLDYVDMALRCDQYYPGDQWDPDDEARLESEGRPAPTINTIPVPYHTLTLPTTQQI